MDQLSSTSTKMEQLEDVVVKDPASVSAKVDVSEDVAAKEGTSADTTDKRGLNKQASSFAAKKTMAQGMMDVALITANANQLRYLIEYQRNSSTFYLIMVLIIISLLLQVAVGISLIFKGRYDMKGKSKSPEAEKINNYVVVAVFLITIINVFIAAFSITPNIQPLPIAITTNPSSTVPEIINSNN